MATPSLATVGGMEFPVGYAGQLAKLPGGGAPLIESRVNENATAIDFGAAVCRGTVTTPGTIGATRPIFNPGVVLGFAVRSLEAANTTVSAGTINYPQKSEVPILREGFMWALAGENATEGDAVVAVVASPSDLGSGTGGAANGTTRLATSATWQQTVTSGNIGLIKVSNNA